MGFNSMPAESPWGLEAFGAGGSIPNLGPNQIIKVSGDSQAVNVNQQFPNPLQVQVVDINGTPVSGDTVTWSIIAGANGASALFSNGQLACSAVTDANGYASSLLFTANGTAGGFTVEAAEAVAGLSAFFGETSNPPVTTPSAPTAVVGSQASATGASVSFTVPNNGGATIDGYKVQIYKDGVLVRTLPTTNYYNPNNIPISVISSVDYVNGHSYTWAVAAHNAQGMGPFSAQSAAVVWGAITVVQQSIMRGLYINQAAGTILAQSDVAGYEYASIQPQQVSGYTAAKNGLNSLAGAPSMASLKSWMNVPSGSPFGPIVVIYVNSVHETNYDRSSPPFWTPYAPDSTWFLYNAAGQKVSFGPGPLMAMVTSLAGASTKWGAYQNRKAAAIAADLVSAWDGIFWDVLSTFSNQQSPIDPLRGGAYTNPNFSQDAGFLGAAMEAGIGFNKFFFVGNSLTSAAKYGFNANGSKTTATYNAGSQQVLKAPIYSGMAESYCRGSNDKVGDFPGQGGNTTGTYDQTVSMIDDICRVKTGAFHGICKLWIAGTTALQQDQWQRVAASLALCGMQHYGSVVISFELSASDTGNYPMMGPIIGEPTDLTQKALKSGFVYYRAFDHGYVFLNTDTVAHNTPIALPAGTPAGHWTDVGPVLSGSPGGTQYAEGSTPSIPPNSALILKTY